MKILAYTFRTFPYIKNIEAVFEHPFVFGKLKIDFESFIKLIRDDTDLIVGLALTKGETQIESIAANQFSGDKIIEKNGVKKINLFVPKIEGIKASSEYSTSFCNWTMYKIASYTKEKNFKTKIIFVHLNKNDLDKINQIKIAILGL